MRVLSLFSGIGGFDLACEWAGMEIVGQVEIDGYCCKVLDKHWPNMKRLNDIFEVRGDEFGTVDLIVAGVPCQPASCAGKRRGTEDDRWLWGEALRVVKIAKPRWCVFENPTGILSLQGGVPFEDILVALETEGYEVQPLIIPACAVNAPHRRDRVWIVGYSESARKRVRQQKRVDRQIFSEAGRKQGVNLFNASSQNATGTYGNAGNQWRTEPAGQQRAARTANGGYDVADSPLQLSHRGRDTGQAGRGESTDGGNVAYANEQGLERHRQQSGKAVKSRRISQSRLGRDFARFSAGMDFPGWPAGWWPTPQARDWKGMQGQSYLGKAVDLPCAVRWPAGPGAQQHEWEPPRIAKGIKHRRERLKALGNAVVPAQVYPILQAIADIEARQDGA